jgi:branched-chain amino acid transport system substrate-binding protein
LAKATFNEPSYTAQCLALMQKGADYIQINLTSDGATRLIADCVRQGYTGTFGLADGTVLASAMADVPAEANVFGVIDGFPWWVEEGPAADFHAAMDAAGLTEEDFGNSSYTALWSSLETFRAVMSGTPESPTCQDVFDAMYALEDEDLEGLLPQKMNFEPGQPAPPVSCFWYYEYTGGAFSTYQDDAPSGNGVTEGHLKTACYEPGA